MWHQQYKSTIFHQVGQPKTLYLKSLKRTDKLWASWSIPDIPVLLEAAGIQMEVTRRFENEGLCLLRCSTLVWKKTRAAYAYPASLTNVLDETMTVPQASKTCGRNLRVPKSEVECWRTTTKLVTVATTQASSHPWVWKSYNPHMKNHVTCLMFSLPLGPYEDPTSHRFSHCFQSCRGCSRKSPHLEDQCPSRFQCHLHLQEGR